MLKYKHIVAIIYTVVLFLDRLDLTIVNITLPTLSHHFHVPIISTDWVTLSFLLALALSIPISDWLGTYFGLKKIYLFALFLFGLGSTLSALSPNLTILIFLRFMQGIGGGLLIPVGMTMLYHVYDKSEYASITSFTFLPSLVAPAIAPFLGGILLENFGWQFVFLFSGPICLVLLIFAFILLKEENHKIAVPLDWLGFILASLLLMDVFYFLSVAGKIGFSLKLLISFIFIIFLIVAFIWREQNTKFPLFNLSLFKNEVFVRANFLQLCFQICHFGAIFLIGMYLQVGIGMPATIAGLIMGMQAIGAMVTSRYSVKLFNRSGPKPPITMGLLGVAFLTPCILFISHPSKTAILFGLVLFFFRGIFSGLCGTPIQTLSVIDFPKEKLGAANSIFNACRQISISFGVAISSILISLGCKINGIQHIIKFGQDEVYKVFTLGFVAIPIIAIIGVFIVKNLKNNYVNSINN